MTKNPHNNKVFSNSLMFKKIIFISDFYLVGSYLGHDLLEILTI